MKSSLITFPRLLHKVVLNVSQQKQSFMFKYSIGDIFIEEPNKPFENGNSDWLDYFIRSSFKKYILVFLFMVNRLDGLMEHEVLIKISTIIRNNRFFNNILVSFIIT